MERGWVGDIAGLRLPCVPVPVCEVGKSGFRVGPGRPRLCPFRRAGLGQLVRAHAAWIHSPNSARYRAPLVSVRLDPGQHCDS